MKNSKNFGMEIPPEKSETMAILGQDRVRCEIVVDNKRLQYVQTFKYLGCEISYENDKDDFLRCVIPVVYQLQCRNKCEQQS
jgi:hypothetical protein